MKLTFKSDNCAHTLSSILPQEFKDMEKCLKYLKLSSTIFNDGHKWHILHDDKIVCLILENEVLCKYTNED